MSSKMGLVVSDLHLFSRKSERVALMKGLAAELRDVGILVLNGDTFDFRWSEVSGEDMSI